MRIKLQVMNKKDQQQLDPYGVSLINSGSIVRKQSSSFVLIGHDQPKQQLSGSNKTTLNSINSYQQILKVVRRLITNKSIPQAIQYINQQTQRLNNKQSVGSNLNEILLGNKEGKNRRTIKQQYECKVLFSLGSCYLSQKKYQKSLETLLQIKQKNEGFKQNQISLMIAICYNSLNNPTKALQTINSLLIQQNHKQQFKISDHLFLKATILKGLAQFDEAQLCLKEVIKRQSKHKESYGQLLDIYSTTQNYQKAKNIIDQALNQQFLDSNFKKNLLIKKVQFQYKNKEYDQCIKNINILIEQDQKKQDQSKNNKQDKKNSHSSQINTKQEQKNKNKLLYIQGKALLKINKYQESIICFNDILHLNSSQYFIRVSLIQLALHFLQQRDFYEASLYLKRRDHLVSPADIQLQNLCYLCDGLILLMKKNFQEGLRTLSLIDPGQFQTLLEQQQKVFVNNLYLNGQGYGLLSMGEYEQALNKYRKIRVNIGEEQYLPCMYNIELINGILFMVRHKDEQKSIESFYRSLEYMNRPEPYFYIAVIKCQTKIKHQIIPEDFRDVLDILQKGIAVNKNAQMYYYRSLVFIYLGMNYEAMQDLDRAIQISQDNIAQHFYAKGLIYFLQSNLQQAISQFQVALSINQNYSYALLQKAKCHILLGNSQQGYYDLQRYDSLIETNNIWQLYFMLQQNRYQEILSLDLNQYQMKCPSLVEQIDEIRRWCSFYMGKFEESGPAGKLVLGLIFGSYEQLLLIIDEALQLGISLGPLGGLDMLFIKGYLLFKLGWYSQSIRVYEQIENQLSINQKQLGSDQTEIRLLVVKINIILTFYAMEQYQMCIQKLETLISQINEGPILQQLHFILSLIMKQSQSNRLNSNGQKGLIDKRSELQQKRQGKEYIFLNNQRQGEQEEQKKQGYKVCQSKQRQQIQVVGVYDTQIQNRSKEIEEQKQKKELISPYTVNILNQLHSLSHHLPLQTIHSLQFHIIIPAPILSIPALKPNRHKLLTQYHFTQIENKPEPPWIKRGQYGIIFTNQLQQYNHLHLHTQSTQTHLNLNTHSNQTHTNLKTHSNLSHKPQIQSYKPQNQSHLNTQQQSHLKIQRQSHLKTQKQSLKRIKNQRDLKHTESLLLKLQNIQFKS